MSKRKLWFLVPCVLCSALWMLAGIRAVAAQQQPITTVATLDRQLELNGAEPATFSFHVADWPEDFTPGVEVALRWRAVSELSQTHYINAALNGKPIYMMKIASIGDGTSALKWSSTDLIQGGSAGIELSGSFEGNSTNFARHGDLHVGENELKFWATGDQSGELVTTVDTATRVIATRSLLPTGRVSGQAEFRDGSLHATAEAKHEGLTVSDASVIMLVGKADGTVERVPHPAGTEMADGQVFRTEFSEALSERPISVYLQYDWGSGGSPPVQVWPSREVGFAHIVRLPPASWWGYVAALIALWLTLSNMRLLSPRSRRQAHSSRNCLKGRFRTKLAVAGVTAIVLFGVGVAVASSRCSSHEGCRQREGHIVGLRLNKPKQPDRSTPQ